MHQSKPWQTNTYWTNSKVRLGIVRCWISYVYFIFFTSDEKRKIVTTIDSFHLYIKWPLFCGSSCWVFSYRLISGYYSNTKKCFCLYLYFSLFFSSHFHPNRHEFKIMSIFLLYFDCFNLSLPIIHCCASLYNFFILWIFLWCLLPSSLDNYRICGLDISFGYIQEQEWQLKRKVFYPISGFIYV